MRRIRLYVDIALAAGQSITLSEATANHAVRVLRLREGDAVTLFNGDGFDYVGTISLGKRDARVHLNSVDVVTNESPLAITLVQAIARGEKMDLILQKATELGVVKIVPVISDRTEVKLDEDRADKRILHWQRVLEAACEQCGRAQIPEVESPSTLERAARLFANANDTKLVLHPDGGRPLSQVDCGDAATIAIGPEGGFSERDLALFDQAGFVRITLGPRVLRTETAGLAAIAALQTRFGDFG
ncbi:MAG TPA: 16S rRNA (uracil(1498)-N(3))-methyltransferase [Pseudomonadota bacterium]|nr:16S rRNA (uracil(1498)-N(3))-methyltransferase [Rhodanobacteraceae bacterium]MBP9155092.1 16S rRNA (uracil(1498)-N(3))-methyltransferase [Xanthomonadales bacterium]HQW82134.1 16S rRNA (uracil(1498)-N(3))-methyltransferase [Pseudomonadota bacterium]